MNFISDRIAERLGGINFGKTTEIYKFEMIKRAKAEVRKSHPEIALIDLGVGEPDWPADSQVVQTLCQEAGKAENRLYADNGIPEFQNATAQYLKNVYGLTGINRMSM